MESFGIVFRDANDDIWLGLYENSTIRDFGPLSDFDGFYTDLPYTKFAMVAVREAENEQVLLKDICTFEVGRHKENVYDEDPTPTAVTEMLADMNYPSDETDEMFTSFLGSAGKTN